MMSKPIKPSEVVKSPIPDVVFDVFNELIQKNFKGKSARFKQKDVDELLRQKGLTPEDINNLYETNGLDVELAYKKEGWDVEYDSPAGLEAYYDETFTFTKKRK
jgi:hypothetical protein